MWQELLLHCANNLSGFESNTNGIRENIAGHSNVDTATIRETLEIQSEELSEDGLVSINEGSACDRREKDVPEKVMSGKKLNIKETLRDISQH